MAEEEEEEENNNKNVTENPGKFSAGRETCSLLSPTQQQQLCWGRTQRWFEAIVFFI